MEKSPSSDGSASERAPRLDGMAWEWESDTLAKSYAEILSEFRKIVESSSFENVEMPIDPCWPVFDPVLRIDFQKSLGIFVTNADQSSILQAPPKNEFATEFD